MAAATLASSCSNVGCTENQNSVPLAGFYSMQTGEAIAPDSLAVGGVDAPNDTLLLGPGSRVKSLYLPFRSTHQSTEFYIQYKQKELEFFGLADTLRFEYTAIPYFASEDCGAMYHYRVTAYDYTTYLIDSVAVTDSLITNIDRETIRIFFRTGSGESEEEEESDGTNETNGTNETDGI